MTLRIETPGPFELVGYRFELPRDDHPFVVVPQLWSDLAANGGLDAIAALSQAAPWGPLGASVMATDGTATYWMAATSAPGEAARSSAATLATHEVPAGASIDRLAVSVPAWAVLSAVGPLSAPAPSALQRLIDQHCEIVDAAGYTRVEGPLIEEYSDTDTTAADYECWLWVPIAAPTS